MSERRGFAKPKRGFIPSAPQLVALDAEMRIDRPYLRAFDSLTYIGVVERQTWQVSPHYHEHFELCYIAEGRGWFQQGGHYYETQPGDLFLSKPGECHYGAAAPTLPFRLYYLGFQLSQLPQMAQAFAAIDHQRVARDPHGTSLLMFTQMLEEGQQQRLLGDQMTQGLFRQLLVTVVRLYAAQPQTLVPTTLRPTVQRALDAIHADIGSHHTIDSLAHAAHSSRAQLTRVFRQATGVSIQAYIAQLCLDRASYYLRETEESITWVAEQLHFSSLHAFSMFFKRHAGCSPLHYRWEHMVHEPQC